MNNKISPVWAVPVDDAQLAARTQAYVAVKPTSTTLTLCEKYTAPLAFRALMWTPEVAIMIENQLEDVVYQSKIQHWLESRDCAQEIFEESGLFTTNRPKTGNLRHYNMAQSYLRKVSLATSSKATTKLMRCINIFAHDSALYARFVVLRPPDYENQTYYSTSDPADVSASYGRNSQILVDQTKQAASDAYESAKKVTEQGAFALTDDLRPGGEPGGKGLAGDPGPGSGP